MNYPTGLADEALELLRQLTGDPATAFRPDQLQSILTLAGGRGRVLLVQRTGWGKSAVYFIATRLLRDRGFGPTLLVSPLLALMRNQIQAAERLRVRAATINSSNTADWEAVEAQIEADEVDVLLISPERLANQRFRDDVLPSGRPAQRAAGDRRGPLHLRLGPRLPARLPTARAGARPAPGRGAGAVLHGHRQRPGGGRRDRAARRRLRAGQGAARPGRPSPARSRQAVAARAAGLARRRDREAPRHRHRLLPDGRRHRAGRRMAAIQRHNGSGLQRRERRPTPARRRAGAAVQRGQGRGGDLGVGDGIRQARPRLRDPLPVAGLAGGLLPAGRPGRACPPRVAGSPVAGCRRRRHPGLLHRVGLPSR